MAVQAAVPTSKLPTTVRYAEAEYWESRYKREPSVFEWFFGHTALRRIIRAYISKKKPVLHVGCGASNLQEGMAQSGYNVVNTDISQVVISQMKERHCKYQNMTYQVSDCRDMPEFMDCQFGSVIDKGTIDALLCCKQGTENVIRMLNEVHRVLQPGGVFLLVTLGDPTRRLPLLLHPCLNWKVSLLLLPKISAACQAYVDGKPINDTVLPIDADGPYEVLDADTIVGLPPGVQYSNFFFAYVCKTRPLQLPLAQGQKAHLPNGWVAGSKELFQKLQKELGLPEDLLAKGRRKRVVVLPAGSSASMTGLGHGSQASSSASSSHAATAHGTPKKYDQGLSPGREDQQQQAGAAQLATQPIPSPLQQLQQQRQQQEAAVAKLEELLAASVQQRQNLSQKIPKVSGMDTHDIPTRPASAPNLANLLQHSAAAATASAAAAIASAAAATASTAATSAASLLGVGVPPAVPHAQARDDVQILPCSAPVLCPYASTSQVWAAESAQPHIIAQPATQAAAADVVRAGLQLASNTGNGMSMLIEVEAAVAPDEVAAEQQPWETQGMPGWLVTNSAAQSSTTVIKEEEEGQEGGEVVVGGDPEQQQQPWSMLGRPSPAEAAATAAGDPTVGWSILGRPSPAEAAAMAAGQMPSVGAPLIPLLPRPGVPAVNRAPRLRRFSTDSPAIRLAAFSTQLALLRQQQSLHSERAADGLVMHDVAANEAYGGTAAAAALAAAVSWGRSLPPRCRRLSAVSNTSLISSTSISATGEDELSEITDEFASLCTTTAEGQLVPEGEEEGQQSEAGAEDTPAEVSNDNLEHSLSSSMACETAHNSHSDSLLETLVGQSRLLSNSPCSPHGLSTPLSGRHSRRQSPGAGAVLGLGLRPGSSTSGRSAELQHVSEVQEQGVAEKHEHLGLEQQHDELQYDQRLQHLHKLAATVQLPQRTGVDASIQLTPAARKECDQSAQQQQQQQPGQSNVLPVH